MIFLVTSRIRIALYLTLHKRAGEFRHIWLQSWEVQLFSLTWEDNSNTYTQAELGGLGKKNQCSIPSAPELRVSYYIKGQCHELGILYEGL